MRLKAFSLTRSHALLQLFRQHLGHAEEHTDLTKCGGSDTRKKRGNWQVLPVGQLADEKLTHMDRLEALTSVFEVQSLELAMPIGQKRTHLHCRIL